MLPSDVQAWSKSQLAQYEVQEGYAPGSITTIRPGMTLNGVDLFAKANELLSGTEGEASPTLESVQQNMLIDAAVRRSEHSTQKDTQLRDQLARTAVLADNDIPELHHGPDYQSQLRAVENASKILDEPVPSHDQWSDFIGRAVSVQIERNRQARHNALAREQAAYKARQREEFAEEQARSPEGLHQRMTALETTLAKIADKLGVE